MVEDKRTIVILIRVRKQGSVMFPLFVLRTLIISDPVYETPPNTLDSSREVRTGSM